MDNTEIHELRLKIQAAKILRYEIEKRFTYCNFDIECFEKLDDIPYKVLVSGPVVKIILSGHNFYDHKGELIHCVWVADNSPNHKITYNNVIHQFNQIGLFTFKRLALVGFEVEFDELIPATYLPIFRAIWR